MGGFQDGRQRRFRKLYKLVDSSSMFFYKTSFQQVVWSLSPFRQFEDYVEQYFNPFSVKVYILSVGYSNLAIIIKSGYILFDSRFDVVKFELFLYSA